AGGDGGRSRRGRRLSGAAGDRGARGDRGDGRRAALARTGVARAGAARAGLGGGPATTQAAGAAGPLRIRARSFGPAVISIGSTDTSTIPMRMRSMCSLMKVNWPSHAPSAVTPAAHNRAPITLNATKTR